MLCLSQADEESMKAAETANVKKRWREQHDDVLFPDEVITMNHLDFCHTQTLVIKIQALAGPDRACSSDESVSTNRRVRNKQF